MFSFIGNLVLHPHFQQNCPIFFARNYLIGNWIVQFYCRCDWAFILVTSLVIFFTTVFVICDPDVTNFIERSKEGFFSIIPLAIGEYEYKFYVDEKWLHAKNQLTRYNTFGTLNNYYTLSEREFAASHLLIQCMYYKQGMI